MTITPDGRFDLGLTGARAGALGGSAAGSCGCGGGGACMCGGHGAGSSTIANARVLAELPDAIVAEYDLTGLTCDNCVRHVAEEFASIDGVQTVDVRLVVGGVSTVRVASDEALDPAAVAAAVDEAGYALA